MDVPEDENTFIFSWRLKKMEDVKHVITVLGLVSTYLRDPIVPILNLIGRN